MTSITDTSENRSATCNFCGNGIEEADIYACDVCDKVFCEACAPYREDDAPTDVCEECIEP